MHEHRHPATTRPRPAAASICSRAPHASSAATITNNRATGSACYLEVAFFNIRLGVGGGGGVNFDESKASISNSTIENNTAKAGGGVFADNSPASISTSIIENNQATASATIIPIIILANTAGGGGAHLWAAQCAGHRTQSDRQQYDQRRQAAASISSTAPPTARSTTITLGLTAPAKAAPVYMQFRSRTRSRSSVLPITIPALLLPILLGKPQPDPPKLVMQNNTIAHNQGSSAVHFLAPAMANG